MVRGLQKLTELASGRELPAYSQLKKITLPVGRCPAEDGPVHHAVDTAQRLSFQRGTVMALSSSSALASHLQCAG